MRLSGQTLFGLLLAAAAPAQDRAEIEKIVREYILAHPEVVMESVRGYQDRQRAERQREARGAIEARRAELLADPAAPVAGGSEGRVPVVVFSDYRCGYCRRSSAAVLKLAAGAGAYVIFKELPVLGPESALAASAALAAHRQGSYLKFHEALMAGSIPFTLESMEQLASKLSLDVERFRSDLRSPAIADVLARNQQLAGQLGIQATPSFVIGSELVSGALDTAALDALIAKAREKKGML